MKQTIAWTLAGSDASGGAGIQADLKTFHALGVQGGSILTAVTAQNAQQINHIDYLSPASVVAQLETLKHSLPPKAIKIGMLGQTSTIQSLIAFLRHYTGYVVLDTPLQSSSQTNLFCMEEKDYLVELKKLFPFVDILTPNLQEAEKILGRALISYEDIEKAAADILAYGAKSVLIKGGHIADREWCQDYWSDGKDACWLTNKRLPNRHYRGTGCVLSAGMAACLALGYAIKDALVIAKMYVHQAMRLATVSDHHAALLAHVGWPEEQVDLPYLTHRPLLPDEKIFPLLEKERKLGLYPVVDSVAWLHTLLPLGVKTIQLRVKEKEGLALEAEIKAGIALAKHYHATLFINDHWQLAIRHQADGVHLGQEDIDKADVTAIQQAGIKLGISTHCYHEVAKAHAFHPYYLACGPIFATTSKIMPHLPQGIAALKRWRRTLRYPLVAIGGINGENLMDVLSTQVEGIAMISAITRAENPREATQTLLERVHAYVPHPS